MSEYQITRRGYIVAAGSCAFFSYDLAQKAVYHYSKYQSAQQSSLDVSDALESLVQIHQDAGQSVTEITPRLRTEAHSTVIEAQQRSHALVGGASGLASGLFATLAISTLVQALRKRTRRR
jgi:hypothetical protein